MSEKNLKYTKTHEWIRIENELAYIGITEFAQNAMGDIVFVELPEIDDEFQKGEEISNIESVKAASPIYAPISGTVIKINETLTDTPELINQNPYESFIICLRITEINEIDKLLTKEQYDDVLKQEKENGI